MGVTKADRLKVILKKVLTGSYRIMVIESSFYSSTVTFGFQKTPINSILTFVVTNLSVPYLYCREKVSSRSRGERYVFLQQQQSDTATHGRHWVSVVVLQGLS